MRAPFGESGWVPSIRYIGQGRPKGGIPVGLTYCLRVRWSPDCWKKMGADWPLRGLYLGRKGEGKRATKSGARISAFFNPVLVFDCVGHFQ